jgi:hypothetical protein
MSDDLTADTPGKTEPPDQSGMPIVVILCAAALGAVVGLILYTCGCGLYFDRKYPDSNLAGLVAIAYGFKYGAPLGAIIGGCIGLFVASYINKSPD